jgi:peptide/nickel transport system substrate-binding protein
MTRRRPSSSRSRRWLFLPILAGGVAAFAAVWYAAARDSGGDQPAFGGSYVEGVTGAPARINPLFAGQNTVDQSLVELVFSGLTRLDDRDQPFPDLAESWDISADGRSYTFRLRRGVLWQDGSPFTAGDVVFTLGLLQSPDLRTPPPLAQALAGAAVRRVDDFTVRIDLPQPFAPLLAYLSLGILPQHLLGQTRPADLFDSPFNLRPVGTGAYRLEQLNGERALLVANPGYHFGQPYVQHLELRFFRDDGALMSALTSGRVQGAFFGSGTNPGDLSNLRSRKDLAVSALSSGEVTFIYFNLSNPIFQDRRVRQALTYAIDRDALVGDALAGQFARADSPLAPGTWAADTALARYGADASVATALLTEAGWVPGPGGVRTKDGQPLSFTMATNNDPVRVAVAQAIADRWKAIGVDVTVQAGGATTLVRDLLEPRSYQAVLFAYQAGADPDPFAAWHSSQTGRDGRNVSLLRDQRFDRLLEDARATPDQARRADLYRQFQELFAQEMPAIPLYSSVSLYVQKKSVKGTRVGYLDNAGARFWQVQDWYVKTKK